MEPGSLRLGLALDRYVSVPESLRSLMCYAYSAIKVMKQQKQPEQILKEYEEKSEAILQKMMQILIRAQRKVDDTAYRKALQQLDEELL